MARVDGSSHRTLLVVLAAGGGSRFDAGSHKLLAELEGRTVVARSVAAALGSGVGPVLVVSGAIELEPELGDLDVTIARNPHWRDGQAASLAVAVDHARAGDAEAVVVGLGDQPLVEPSAWRAVAASAAPIAVATYAGRRGNPVRLHHSIWDLLPRSGDEGARSVMRLRPELVEAVPCLGSSADIDTLADLEHAKEHLRWQSRSSTSSP